ncbi:MAG: DNA polymerase III subunit delta' [Comamonas sp.]
MSEVQSVQPVETSAPWITAQRRQLLAQRGHAWLLQGPSGLGQYALGLSLVRAWLCERPGAEGACGQCASCHAIDVRAHADLCVLMPEVQMLALGWPLPEKAQADIDDKKRKPSKEIRVEAMRDAVEFCQRTSARGRGKALLIYPAEQMNAITANALLKTLEEPPGDARFVLASEAAHQLLPTIRSRCLGHTMTWPDAQSASTWLLGQGVDAAEADAALQAAGGRPGDALALAKEGKGAAAWSQLPRQLAKGDVAALSVFSPVDAVSALQKICHDLMALTGGGAPRYFSPADLPSKPLSMALLSDWSRELVAAARTADHPFNSGLMMESLAARARSVLLSGNAARVRGAVSGRGLGDR